MTEAKLKYKQGSFEVIKEGDYVLCAISKKKILLKDFLLAAVGRIKKRCDL